MQRIGRSPRCLAGELAEVVRTVSVGHELAEKALVGRRLTRRPRRIPGRELLLECLAQLRGTTTPERLHGVVGDVDDELVGVAVLFADTEHDAAGHSALHQRQVAKPHLFMAQPRVDFTVDDREDHCVVVGFYVLFQQGLFGGSPQCRFLAGDKAATQGMFGLHIRRLEKRSHMGLILGANIQAAA